MDLTFRSRLMVWFVLTVGGLFTLAAITLAYNAERLADMELDKALTAIAAARFDSIAPGDARPAADGPTYYFTLADRDGNAVAHSDNLPRPLPIDRTLFESSLGGRPVYESVNVDGVGPMRVVYFPQTHRSDAGVVLLVGVPADIFREERRGLYWSIFIYGIVLVVLSIGSAYYFANYSVRPLESVTSAAQRITARNLTEKLPDPAVDDEIGRLVNVFNEMLSRLDAAFMAQRRFSSRVAHELRTPLTILKGETQVTLNRRRSTEEYEAQLVSILEEVAKMERTIDDLLLFARYEAGETQIPFRPVHLDPVVADAAKDLRPLAERRRINFEIDVSEDAVVLGDEQALSRLVCKLIENALHYTPENGRVLVRVVTDPDRTVLSVRDTGVGIAAADVPHIFERFYRSDRSRNMHSNGTGLGLSFVHVIARLHKAEISVDSRPNEGTEFAVTFPRSAAPQRSGQKS
jgi:heavy metal sensor kinase